MRYAHQVKLCAVAGQLHISCLGHVIVQFKYTKNLFNSAAP